MRIHRYKFFINEKVRTSLEEKLTIEKDSVKLWHYSSVNITNGIISKSEPHGIHSISEFRAWGRERVFFYGNEEGYSYDKLPPSALDYKYISYIPLSDIYDINLNHNDYDGTLEEEYQQSSNDGYTSWTYYLGGNEEEEAPIVISFDDVKIYEAYRKTEGGVYVDKDIELLDYKIGTIRIDDDNLYIMQKDGYNKSLINTYLTYESDQIEAMESYKKSLETYMWKDVDIYSEYIKYYLNELKKVKNINI